MKLLLWLSSCGSLIQVVRGVHDVKPADFGVGFTLHFDYGVAAIYYTNGSSNGIAKIEGSPAYKHIMRQQTWQLPEPYGTEPVRVEGMLWGYTGWYKQGLRDMPEYLPPWLSDIQPDARTDVLAPMLAALTAAFVAHTGTNNSDVFVTFAAHPQTDFIPVVAAAAARSGVSMPFLMSESPAGFVLDAYGLSSDPCYSFDVSRIPDRGPMQLLLVVDASRAAISASLRSVWCGIDNDLRTMMNTSLGLGAWSEETHWSLVEDMRQFIRPVANGEGRWLDKIERVVLSGESAYDGRLRSVLQEVVEDSVVPSVSDAIESGEGHVDPLFAAAIGAAKYAWYLSHENPFDYEVSMGD
ncbi:hypothetical protein LTR95_011723 [Oleoguttula sp. CCFEE 5521]